MIKLRLDESSVKYVWNQLTTIHNSRDKSIENYEFILSEVTNKNFDLYDDLLGIYDIAKSSENILEIGSGVGRCSCFLNKKIKKGNFYLADGYGEYRNGLYNWEDHDFYNSLEETKKFCKLNNLDNLNLIDVTSSNKSIINFLSDDKKFDFVFSIFCLGFHQSISSYEDVLKNTCHKDTYFFITLNKDKIKEEEETISRLFSEFEIKSLEEYRFPFTNKKYHHVLLLAKGIRQ